MTDINDFLLVTSNYSGLMFVNLITHRLNKVLNEVVDYFTKKNTNERIVKLKPTFLCILQNISTTVIQITPATVGTVINKNKGIPSSRLSSLLLCLPERN